MGASKLCQFAPNRGTRKFPSKLQAGDLCPKVPETRRKRHIRGYNDKENDKKWKTLFHPDHRDFGVDMGAPEPCQFARQQMRKTFRQQVAHWRFMFQSAQKSKEKVYTRL